MSAVKIKACTVGAKHSWEFVRNVTLKSMTINSRGTKRKIKVPTGWQPIETAPTDVSPVWLWGGTIETELGDETDNTYGAKAEMTRWGRWDVCDTCGYAVWVCNPTHWMELPQGPACATTR